MSSLFDYRIEGGEELERLLGKLPVKVERNVLVGGLRESVKPIKRSVRNVIKSRFRTKTGTLLRSIRHRTGKARNGAIVVVESTSIAGKTGFLSGAKRGAAVRKLKEKSKSGKFNDAFYAKFLLLGTKPHKIAARKGKSIPIKGGSSFRAAANHPGIKGVPFFDIGLRASRTEALRVFGKGFSKGFDKEVAKLRK